MVSVNFAVDRYRHIMCIMQFIREISDSQNGWICRRTLCLPAPRVTRSMEIYQTCSCVVVCGRGRSITIMKCKSGTTASLCVQKIILIMFRKRNEMLDFSAYFAYNVSMTRIERVLFYPNSISLSSARVLVKQKAVNW